MPPTRRVVSRDRTRLAVHESGPPDAPVVIAVHGYPDNHTVWDGVTDRLEDRYRIVRYDVRGAGESDRPESRRGYRMQLLVDDLVAVLDAVGGSEPTHLLGHDWGSVQLWAALGDDRVRGRVAGFTSISGPSLEYTARWLRSLRTHPVPALRQLAHSYYTVLFQVPYLPELAIRFGLLDRLIKRHERSDQLNGLQLYRANLFGALRTEPATIELPVQVIVPSNDRYITAALASEAPRPYVPDLRIRTVAGGHWVMVRRPEAIARCITDFAAELAARTT